MKAELFNSVSFDVDHSQDQPTYFNRLEADSDFCVQIHQVYNQCSFCLVIWNRSQCVFQAQYVECGDQPTQEELLSSDEYPLFQTVGDIERACDELEKEYNSSFHLPSTIELCTKQLQVKHLCGGYCDGGCFDGTNGTPPTCEPNSRVMDYSSTIRAWGMCDRLHLELHSLWSPWQEAFLNISKVPEYLRSIPSNSTLCDEAQLAYSECYWCTGENNPWDYLGATIVPQKKALVWMSRVAAFLSFLGACYIIRSIFSNVKRQTSVYYHLLFFATAPIHQDVDFFYQAIGTRATCITQAFFVQLGFTSIFYNVSLAFYYVMVVAYNRKEFQLKTIQCYLHGFPLLVGLGLALGAILVYDFFDYGCHIGRLLHFWPQLVFVLCPLGFSITAITVAMLIVYWKCVFYVLAFSITWPILFLVYLARIEENGPLGLSLTIAFVAPLQGFNNFLVFVRPKAVRMVRERWSHLVKPRTNEPAGGTQSNHTADDRTPNKHHPNDTTTNTTAAAVGDSQPQPDMMEGQTAHEETCVVQLLDGTSQVLEDVLDDDEMDSSALLPLLSKQGTNLEEVNGPPQLDSIQEENAVGDDCLQGVKSSNSRLMVESQA